MELNDFLKESGFFEQSESEKARLLAFFHRKKHGVKGFDGPLLGSWFDEVGLTPNVSRLGKIVKSKSWSRVNPAGSLEINGKTLAEMEIQFPALNQSTDEVKCTGAILPTTIYASVQRKYIRHIADQANWAYESQAYDACAVMMRRLLELLLIHNFRHKGIDDQIKRADGHFQELDVIINVAVSEKKLGLTQGVVKELKRCKDIGNFGAHDIIYTCKKSDIDPIILEYRKTIAHLIDYADLELTSTTKKSS